MRAIWLIFALIFCWACGSKEEGAASNTISGMNHAVNPALGSGYDSLSQRLVHSPSCIQFGIKTSEVHRQELEPSRPLPPATLYEAIQGKEHAVTPDVFYQDTLQAEWLQELSEEDNSLKFHFAYKLRTAEHKVTNPRLLEAFQGRAPLEVLDRCGDSYVMQVNHGGMLLVSLSLHFESARDAHDWSDRIDFDASWPEISASIHDALWKAPVAGRAQVQVKQIGGSFEPNIADQLDCTLGSPAGFAACQTQMDRVFAYARNDFDRKLKEKPVVLEYLTGSLQELGVFGLPQLDEKVKRKRQELAALLSEQRQLEKKILLADRKRLDVPYETLRSAGLNRAHVQEAGLSCFTYTVVETQIDWPKCWQNNQSLQLTTIDPEPYRIHILAVPAGSANGASIQNPSPSTPMQVHFSVSPEDIWTSDSWGDRTFLGRLSLRSDQAPLPSAPLGALILRQTDDWQLSPASAQIAVDPGSTLQFRANEASVSTADRQGQLAIYWRCANCKKHLIP